MDLSLTGSKSEQLRGIKIRLKGCRGQNEVKWEEYWEEYTGGDRW